MTESSGDDGWPGPRTASGGHAVPWPEYDAAPGYLDTATLGLPSRAVADAVAFAVGDWRAGAASAPGYDSPVERAREGFARLVGVSPRSVALGASVSALVALVAAGLPAGSEVLVADDEFTSLLFPLLQREPDGVRVRAVPARRLVDTVSSRTRLVAVSAVRSADGRVGDLEAIAEAAAVAGAWTLVDATQACGWLPLDAGSFDAVVCSGFKWIGAPKGAAFLALSDRLCDASRPLAAGWFAGAQRWSTFYGGPLRLAEDARRLDTAPAWLSFVGAAAALEQLGRLGPVRVRDHDLALADAAREGLGLPPSPSPIVALRGDGVGERVRRAGLRVAERAGCVRASFHLHNRWDDVERFVSAAREVRRGVAVR